jgi:hypothetical protein
MHIRLSLPQSSPKGLLKALALACFIGPGMALATCVVPPGMPDDSALETLLGALPECQREADYLAALGHILNQRGRYTEAGDHLERALMLSPDAKGAQLDYAIALAGMGETESARQLLDDILRDPTLPPSTKLALERQRAKLVLSTDWQSRLVLNARVGHDSNLLGAPNLSALTLTFPGQPLVLPLDESSRPQSGMYHRLDLQLEVQKYTLAGGQVDALLSLRSRRADSLSQANSHQGDALLEHSTYQRRVGGSGYYTGASASVLQAGSGFRYNAYSLTAGLGSAVLVAGCDTRAGAELQERKYLSNNLLSGRYTGLAASLSCERNNYQWLVSAKAGKDNATHAERAGGDQAQYSLRGAVVASSVGWGTRPQGQVLVDIDINLARDSSGYSPLLESGRSRVVRRAASRIEFQHPITSNIQWAVGGEWVVQRSNLPLFGNRSWGPYLALRSAW